MFHSISLMISSYHGLHPLQLMLIKQLSSLKKLLFYPSRLPICFHRHTSSIANMPTLSPLPSPPQPPLTWTHTPEQIISLTKDFITQSKALDDKIASLNETATFENVVKPYAALEAKTFQLMNQLCFYSSVSPNKAIRDASNEADELFDKYAIESGLREDVFKSIHKVYLDFKDSEELDAESKRYIEKLNKQYERNGLGKSKEIRNQIKQLQEKLSVLSIQFSKNLAEQNEFVLFSKEQLSGVPDDVVSQFEQVVTDKGETKLKMTFKYPDLFPVLKYASDPETRKAAFIGSKDKVPQNADLMIETMKLRPKLAKLLGYKNYAEYILEVKMAKNPETVNAFLDDLTEKLKPLGEKELVKLKSLKEADLKTRGLPVDDGFYNWDKSYYGNKMLQDEYKVDEMKIAEYFPMTNTIEKMLKIYETIFNLKFNEILKTSELYNTWHEDVKQFALWKLDDKDHPEFMGYLYFDLHPRPGKYGHAANFCISRGFNDLTTGARVHPSTALVCNFTKDSKDKPSLLKHSEVKTFFHELGHGIHSLVSKTKYAKFHGTAVSRDFVEMPSQLLEYFVWCEDQLESLSTHYLTNEKLPKKLIQSLIASKHVNGALNNLRQLYLGLFDMSLHNSETGDVDLYALWHDLSDEVSLVTNNGIITKGFGSFAHVMGGYAAGYYGYLWSNVYAADIFYTKFRDDPLNVKNGVEYRDKILSKGGSKDEMDNLVDLLGREPNSQAFLKELGISE